MGCPLRPPQNDCTAPSPEWVCFNLGIRQLLIKDDSEPPKIILEIISVWVHSMAVWRCGCTA